MFRTLGYRTYSMKLIGMSAVPVKKRTSLHKGLVALLACMFRERLDHGCIDRHIYTMGLVDTINYMKI